MSEIWAVVHAERDALIRDLDGVPKERWNTPSLCSGWDVHGVLAHLVDDAKTIGFGLITRFVGSGFNFDSANPRGVARERAADPVHTLDEFRAVRERTSSAPAP